MSTKYLRRSQQVTRKLGLSAIFLIATTFFFIGDHFPSGVARIVATAIPTILLLGLTNLFYRHDRFRRYWEVAFAFLSGSFGLFLAWNIPSSPLGVLGASLGTAQGVAVLKLSELLPVALVIIVLTKTVQGNLTRIYIQRGSLRSGLGLGLLLGLIILAVYFGLSWSRIDPAKALPAIPWLIVFAVSNAFYEELLVRGILLRRFLELLGTAWALALSTLCYGLFFVGVQAAVGPVPYGYLVAVLPLGLLNGFIMLKSDSIWGPVSIHAAIDFVFLVGVFASV